MRRIREILAVFATLTTMLAVGFASPAMAAQGTPVASAETITISGAVVTPLTLSVDDLKTYPTETIDVTYTAGGDPQEHSFTGTPLLSVLEAAEFDVPEDAHNPLLSTYIVVVAKDGYQVVLSGGEMDPAFGDQPVYLAWEQDGEPLSGDDGTVRLVVPGDTKGGRYVSGIVSIEVKMLEPVAQ
ncbi:MAG TPA: molybdopterin-dependent oxidoreductase [Thermomicrobiales bacterium]|nr:molybdopterin-dependent oxidoreductase [Thermomicrobiales bacterium]